MNAAAMVRDMVARTDVLRDYTQWHEWHAEQEQERVGTDDAQPHHEAAVALLFAWDAEQTDPQPPARPCGICGGEELCIG